MTNQLCFSESFGTGNQPLTIKTTVQRGKSKAGLLETANASKTHDKEQPTLSWKGRIARSFTNWATKRMKQAVYNGWE